MNFSGTAIEGANFSLGRTGFLCKSWAEVCGRARVFLRFQYGMSLVLKSCLPFELGGGYPSLRGYNTLLARNDKEITSLGR